jgi:hypothetical protein
MFTVSEEEAAAIRAAFEQQSKLSAAIELRRLFPAVTDNVQARNVRASLPDGCRSRHEHPGCLAAGAESHSGAVPQACDPRGPDRDRRVSRRPRLAVERIGARRVRSARCAGRA